MDRLAKIGVIGAMLAAAGCAGTGHNSASDSIAATRSLTAMPAPVSFSQADANGDARVDRHEFELWRRNAIDTAPAAAGGTSGADAFDAADTNHNGVLTLDEWPATNGRR